jgi:hypothetical protein
MPQTANLRTCPRSVWGSSAAKVLALLVSAASGDYAWRLVEDSNQDDTRQVPEILMSPPSLPAELESQGTAIAGCCDVEKPAVQ